MLYTMDKPPSKHFLFSKTSSRRLEDVFSVTLFVFQDVFKTNLQYVSLKRLQDVFKTFSRRLPRRLQDVFKTCLQDVLQLYLQNVLKDKKCYTEDVFSMSSPRRMFAGLVMEKVNERIKYIKNKFKFSKIKQLLKDPKVISYLNIVQEQYAICHYDKAANNIVYICKKNYVEVVVKESGLLNATSKTYQQVNDTLHKVLQQQNNTLDSVSGLKK